MPIGDDTLGPNIVRLGTITCGRTIEFERDGDTKRRPEKESTLTFHTDDLTIATALVDAYGGQTYEDSPNWQYDVVTEATEIEVEILASGFRQWLVQYATAKCLRRCDGTRMVTRDGKGVDEPCACAPEIEAGAERACKPSTVLPVLIDLPVDRFGVWECRSTSWGAARSIKGTVSTLDLIGATGRLSRGILRAEEAITRDPQNRVRRHYELSLSIAESRAALEAGMAAGARSLPSAGEERPALPHGPDPVKGALLDSWRTLIERARVVGAYDQIRTDWEQYRGEEERPEDLDRDRLRTWLDVVRATVEEFERPDDDAGAPAAGTAPAGTEASPQT